MTKSNVYKDVVYFDIVKNGKTLLHLEANEINDLSKYDIEKRIGNELGEGIFNYSMNIKGIAKNKVGRIRGIITDKTKKEVINNMDSKILNDLNKKLDSLTASQSPDVSLMLEHQKRILETQITFYKDRADEYKTKIEKLELKIESLEKQLQDDSGSGLDAIIQGVQMFTGMMRKTPVANTTLSNIPGNKDDIPEDWLNELGKIDYNKISDSQRETIKSVFTQFVNSGKIPIKENEE